MNQKEKDILKLSEDFKDTLENELYSQQMEDRKIAIKDIKYVGEAISQDKINGKPISDKVFLVDIEIKEIDEEGKERITEQKRCYLGNRCIGGTIGDGSILYNTLFENSEPDKIQAVNELLEMTSEQEIENNSMNKLQNKELSEVLTAHLGRKVSEEEVQKMLEEMDENEIGELKEEKEREKDKDENENENENENDLSKKQAEKIKVSGVQRADLEQKVDGKETLGKRLDLQGYDSLYVVYSEKVDEITPGTKRNNTTYSLVGMTKDGEARVLNDEFEMDKSAGNSAGRMQTRVNADGTATRDNSDSSVFVRKSNDMTVSCGNDRGTVRMSLGKKTLEENENTSIQIGTPQTGHIPIEIREIFNRSKGTYQIDKVQDKIEENTEKGCKPEDVKDFNGDETTETHEHISKEYINRVIIDIHQYGEINKVFGIKEVRDKLLRELKENKDKISAEQIIENVKQEMNEDAENLEREHKL